MTGAGKSHPGLMLENNALLLLLRMIVTRIPVGEDDSAGNNYSSDLAGGPYSVGREVLCWDVDGNFAGDTIDVGSFYRLRWG